MADADLLLETVELIYAAGLDGGRWLDALNSVSQLFGAVGATIEVFEKKATPTLLDFHVGGLPPHAEIAYLDHYAMYNPRAAYAFRHLDQTTLCDHQLIDERAMDRDPYYAKYLTSIDLRYFLSGQILNTARAQGVVTIQRSRRQGHVDGNDIGRMLQLLPHVRRSYDMASRLRSISARAGSFEDALEWLADGVAILDGDSALLHANASFRAMVQRADGIRVVKRQIEFDAPAARSRFAIAVAAVLKRNESGDSGATDFRVDRGDDAPPYVVSLRPLVTGTDGSGGAQVIVFFHDPLVSVGHSTLRSLLGLTAAEARLAQALREGISPVEYADRSGLSRNRVYTHLRRLKEKTGCNRLPELIRELNSLQIAVRNGGPTGGPLIS